MSEGQGREPLVQIEDRSRKIGHVVAVMSGKGGVGKSTITALSALGLARRGRTVGILDADITGPSIPKMFGLKPGSALEKSEGQLRPVKTGAGLEVMSLNLLLAHEDDPVIWRGPLIAGAVKQFWNDVTWGELDYLMVDLPPGTGDVPLTVMQSLPLEGAVIVSSPQELAGMVVKKAMRMASAMHVKILGIVENMSYAVCPDCGERLEVFGPSHLEETARDFGIAALGRLPLNPELVSLCDQGRIEEYRGDELNSVVEALEALA
ncbi:MAG TPA: Mrp/NBP35 family ATP-binding protein [Firmicutes bacterium]|nr:Mrp/NBP35 family ATP-binding protein [Bacillota bacterium]